MVKEDRLFWAVILIMLGVVAYGACDTVSWYKAYVTCHLK